MTGTGDTRSLGEGFIPTRCFRSEAITPGLVVLHGDKRSKETSGSARHIPGNDLQRSHEIFSDKEDKEGNARTVLLTTPQTLKSRHGPKGLAQWRKDNDTYGPRDEPPSDWPAHLEGLVRNVIIDEAHVIKKPTSDTSLALQWLDGEFHVFITGTPLAHDLGDIDRFMIFIKPKMAKVWYDVRAGYLKQWKIDQYQNPFTLAANHPAKVLCLTVKAAKDFIIKGSIDADTKGRWLAQVYKATLLRRTYASRIPFDNPVTIGHMLPRLQTFQVSCEMSVAEKKEYDDIEDSFRHKLIEGTKKALKWNFGISRKMSLLIAWQIRNSHKSGTKSSSLAESTPNSTLAKSITKVPPRPELSWTITSTTVITDPTSPSNTPSHDSLLHGDVESIIATTALCVVGLPWSSYQQPLTCRKTTMARCRRNRIFI